jgi:hypothetical protein
MQIKAGLRRSLARSWAFGNRESRPMKRLLLATGFAALLALSAPAKAEPAISRGADHRAIDSPRSASERWFFGDGGFGCPLWWCGDAGLAPERARQADPSERWFFGDGGFDCRGWQCSRARSGVGGPPGGG